MGAEMKQVAAFLEENWEAFKAHMEENGFDGSDDACEEIIDELKGDN